MTFRKALGERFPGTIIGSDYIERGLAALTPLGFDAENTFACVGVCRDEITRGFVDEIQRAWGEAFNFSSLAGFPFLGKTGFTAAIHHAPEEDGHERYIYFAMPHVAIDADGTVGRVWRPGIAEASTACGALIGFHDELESGELDLRLDMDDVEQSLLKQILFRKIRYGEVPDLARLTYLCHDAIVDMLEHLIELTVDRTMSSYAVMTGIQIHCADGNNWVCPGRAYAVIDHRKRDLTPL